MTTAQKQQRAAAKKREAARKAKYRKYLAELKRQTVKAGQKFLKRVGSIKIRTTVVQKAQARAREQQQEHRTVEQQRLQAKTEADNRKALAKLNQDRQQLQAKARADLEKARRKAAEERKRAEARRRAALRRRHG